MLKIIGGAAGGIGIWIVVVTALNLGLRYGWHDYAAVEKAMTFTLAMMIARLTESGISSLAGGWAAASIGKRRSCALVAGVILLLVFLPFHYSIWSKFPVWYHLTFLVSLPVLSVLGGRLAKVRG
ncbi:MAG TPA: hypothetical protein VGT78_12230 [Rhizomicrobium sp.]|nr:hypothetical protein [Rhizomicrobium sp.]